MEREELLKRFQKRMQYTDEDMELFMSNPKKVKMLTETPEYVKCKVIAEVIESKGCHAQHHVGDKFVLTPGGLILPDQCTTDSKGLCVYAMAMVSRISAVILERLLNKADPNYEKFNIVQCTDIGLDKGGWGKIFMKVYVEGPK